jgi:crotonobetainyl-CoA:carnitine CoA-transferase CaiB-like acyl-CoA transferase
MAPQPLGSPEDRVTGDLPLTGLRVVDLSTWIAGGYCTKLLTDAGVDVVKVEPPEGDPLRRWSASGATIPADADGALFNFLHASQRSVAIDTVEQDPSASLSELLASADAVVWSRGSAVADQLRPHEILRAHPHLTTPAIPPFGLEGPWSDKPSTEFTLQAWSGSVIGLGRGASDRPPVHVGGQVGEWLAGLYAAIGTLASTRRAGTEGEIVDVSMLEAQATCLTYYPVTFHDLLGRPMRKKRGVVPPSVAAAQDGLVGLGVGTGQQWLDFCAMVGHPEWTEDQSLFLNRAHLAPDIDDWVGKHTVNEVLETATAFRIPNAPIVHGANAESMEHFQQRSTFVPNPSDRVANPRPPYRSSSLRARTPKPAPRLGMHPIVPFGPGRAQRNATESGPLPFSGLRVLDMTAYWSGPLVGHVLSMLGAEVIHLESPKRPDGARMVGGISQKQEQYWERGPIFAALNANKKGLAIDLATEQGLSLLKQFVRTCDVVVENFTPRVLDQLGLSYDALREVRNDLVMVRMPGFGLDGPWRELAAFAFVIEDASGLTWLTGHPDQLPLEPYCVGDPNAGLHALFGMMVALEHRDRTGEGSLVEAAMVDAALNITAEQVIEHSAYGNLLTREGNRGPLAVPQNIYHASGPDDFGRDDSWVAIAITSDDQWQALCAAIGRAEWATDADFATAARRAERHDEIDAELERWCRERTAEVIVDTLWNVGVPVGDVIQPHRQADLDQLQFRGFFEELKHPVVGGCRYSTLPMRFSSRPDRIHRRHAPLLGEHNAELLGELGLSRSEIDALDAAGVIGQGLRSPAGAT